MPYTPIQYPLSNDVVPAMKIYGSEKINNAQGSVDPVDVYSYGGSKLSSNLHAITDAMIQQSNTELAKHAQFIAVGTPKTIDLKVTYFKSTYVAFYWHSSLTYQVTLGNGSTFEKTVKHGSGILIQDLNGCIADSVGDFLTDGRVNSYLTQK